MPRGNEIKGQVPGEPLVPGQLVEKVDVPPAEEVVRPVKKKLTPTTIYAQQRRDSLLKEKAEIVKVKDPAQAVHDRMVNDPKLLAADKTIRECNGKLGPIENELAELSKIIGTTALSQGPGAQADAEEANKKGR